MILTGEAKEELTFVKKVDGKGGRLTDKTVDVLLEEDANIQYRFRDLDEVFENLGEIINHHIQYQRPRLAVLDDYYKGFNVGILSREGRTNGYKADNRLAHGFAKYISEFVQGYMTGVPIKVGADDEKLKELIGIIEEENEVDSLNSELVLDLSKYGRAYELVFFKERLGDKTVQLDVENTFLIYDTSVSSEELCGVYYMLTDDRGKLGSNGGSVGIEVTVYTENYVYVLRPTYVDNFKVEIDDVKSKPHSYGEVPIIEYRVGKDRQGDYEQVIPLIDAYDKGNSDVSNFMTDFNESMLMFNGDTEGLDWTTLAEDLSDRTLLEVNTGTDEDGNPRKVEVGYLTREYDFNGSNSYLDRKKEDIHQLSYVPNMSDESFGQNTSGKSLKYKMYGLVQKVGKKMRAMERGFNKRYRLFVTSKEFTNDFTGIKDTKVTYQWTENIPENIEDELKAFIDAGGELSQSTLLSTLSFVNSSEDEKKRILAEKVGVTVEEINKLSPEEMRYVMSRVRGQELVNLHKEDVKEDSEDSTITSRETEGVAELERLKKGE